MFFNRGKVLSLRRSSLPLPVVRQVRQAGRVLVTEVPGSSIPLKDSPKINFFSGCFACYHLVTTGATLEHLGRSKTLKML